jgi:DNA-binding Lrp family transcriptional regulator
MTEPVLTATDQHDPPTSRLDATNRAILAALTADGRMTNSALARHVGVAESTCIHRVRALREAGVITGVHAEVDLAMIGLPIQALIHIRLGHNNQREVRSFQSLIGRLPGLLAAFYVAGADDYLLHVAVAGPEALRVLVADHISNHPAVSHTETQLVFDVTRRQPPTLHPAQAADAFTG